MSLFYRLCLSLLVCVGFSLSAEALRVSDYTKQKLAEDLKESKLSLGDSVYLRLFKKEASLELWMQPRGQAKWKLFRSYSICKNSGILGPKTKKGDKQAPEGFYKITQRALNPNSSFHLSMDMGYPNEYDRYYGRTGSLLMIHGSCVSIGCYAMGDSQIEEIYYLMEHAFLNGQDFINVHAFPFELSEQNITKYRNNRWYFFWRELKAGYDYFNQTHQVPVIQTSQGHYQLVQ